MTEHIYSNWKPKHLDTVVEDEVDLSKWVGRERLFYFLDSLEPIGSPDFIDGWNSLASYIRLEFTRW